MIIFVFFLLFWIGLSFRYSYIVFILLFLILIALLIRKYKWKLALISSLFFLLGIGVSYIKIDINQNVYEGFVVDSKENYFLFSSKLERLYVYSKDNPYEIGDYLSISGNKQKLDFVTLESDFNFTEYLEKKGVRYELITKKIETKFQTPIRIKAGREAFLSHFNEETREVVSSLMFSDGDKGVVLNNIENLHLSRLVNMSGVYIYAFLSMLEFLFSYLFNTKWSKLISILTLLPYFIFTFPRFTIIRIFVVQIFRWINKYLLNGKIANLNLIGIVGLMFLIFDYHLAYQDSFIIGFTLPILVIIIREGVYQKKKWKARLIETFLIYLLIIPFELKYYSSINPFLIPLQFVLTPFFLLFALFSLMSFYKLPLFNVVTFSLKPIEGMGSFFNRFNISINAPPFIGMLLLIDALRLVIFYYYRVIRYVPIVKGLTLVISSFLLIYFLPINNLLTESVTFINVGQGDSCLIRKQNRTVLIDTGGSIYKDIAKDCLIPYFKKERIYHLDLVITTHGDFDHDGALNSLLENFYVKNVVTEASKFPINVGDIHIENYNSHIAEYDEENDRSLVLGFNLLHKNYLIMGDAPIKVERNIMKEYPNLKCDVLKLGHHGSNTSTCDEFIKFLKPEVAIISCGKNNKYHHPHKDVIDILNINHIPYRRTDMEGSISFSNYIFM